MLELKSRWDFPDKKCVQAQKKMQQKSGSPSILSYLANEMREGRKQQFRPYVIVDVEFRSIEDEEMLFRNTKNWRKYLELYSMVARRRFDLKVE